MKIQKIFSILVVLVALSFTSCKKDYVCTCTVTDGSGNVIASSSDIITDSKSEAEAKCNESDGEILGVVTECELD